MDGPLSIYLTLHDPECQPFYIPCANGLECISNTSRCNGVPQCFDLSDETGCDVCSLSQLRCGSICISRNKICDGVPDCLDYTDEFNCCKSA